MSLKNIVKPLVLTSIDSATLTGVYVPINPNGTEAPSFYIRINNDSTEPILISYDGVNDHDFIASGDKLDLQLQTNSGPVNQSAYLAKGSRIYVKEYDDVGTGDIFLSGYYQPN